MLDNSDLEFIVWLVFFCSFAGFMVLMGIGLSNIADWLFQRSRKD